MLNRSTAHDIFDQLLEESDLANLEAKLAPSPETEAEAETPENGEADETATPTATSAKKRWLRRVAAGVAGLLFVGALATAGFFGWQVKQQHDITAAGQAASAAANAYAVTLTTVDYQKIDQNFAQVLDGATGEFKDMYSQSSAQLRQLLVDNKAVSHGTVTDSAIKSAGADKVQVLLFVDQSITNSVNPSPRIDRNRIAMTMERIDGRWLASKVDLK